MQAAVEVAEASIKEIGHYKIKQGAVLDNLQMGYEKDNEEEPLRSL